VLLLLLLRCTYPCRALSAERLASIDTRAAQLSCQAAALQAKAAGAEGLLLAEQARAQAAEADAHGLQVSFGGWGAGWLVVHRDCFCRIKDYTACLNADSCACAFNNGMAGW
jgi:hypothetical protein